MAASTGDRLIAVVKGLALVFAFAVTIALPGGYFTLSYSNLSKRVETITQVKAAAVNALAGANPDLWPYELLRMEELLLRHPVLLVNESAAVRDAAGNLLLTVGATPAAPVLVHSFPVFDSARVIGQVEITHSYREVVFGTLVAALLGVVLGVMVYATALILPLRTLRRLSAALQQEKTALRESEARFRSLTDLSSDWYWEQDREVRMSFHSSGFALHSGTTSDKLLGKRRWEEPNRYPLKGTWEEHRAVLEAHQPFRDFEYVRIGVDGTKTFASLSGEPVFDAAGNFNGYRGVGRSITEHKLQEEVLKKSEERLHRAEKLAHIGNWEWDIQTGDLHWEEENYRIFGLPPETIPSVEIFLGTVHPDDLAFVKQSMTDTLEAHKPYDMDMRIRRPDGTERVIHAYGEVDRDAGGKPIRFFGTVQDITDQKRAEEALARESYRNQAFLRNASDGVHILDADGNVLEVSDSFCQMLGYSREELMGANLSLWVARRSSQELKQRVAEQAAKRGRTEFETQHRRRDGSIFDVEVTSQFLELDGKPVLFSSARDVTERKRLEELHLQSQKLESLGTLSGGIAHDLNNILLAINGNAKLALEDLGEGHAARACVTEIVKAGARASDLVRRILTFARQQAAKREVIQLRPVLEEALKLLRSTLPAMIEFRPRYAAQLPWVAADSTQLHEVVVNLGTNAAHAIGIRPGWIEFALEPVEVDADLASGVVGLRPGSYARLSVADNGCGMDEATVERIFDAFFTTKSIGQGTGLGLSMVHGIMRAHEGAIGVETTLGKGSTFHLYFPAVQGPVGEQPRVQASEPALAQGKRVLYIDDEEALVDLMGRVLERAGHRVLGFIDAKKALGEFRSRPNEFDVVVTDLSMPGMSGFDVAREVMALRPGMPVILTSGHVRVEDEERARAAGIRNVVLKPNTFDELGKVLDGVFKDTRVET